MGKNNFAVGLYNGNGALNELYGKTNKKNVRTQKATKVEKLNAIEEEKKYINAVADDKKISSRMGKNPTGVTYVNANGGEYKIYADKKYRVTDNDGYSMCFCGEEFTQDAVEYINAQGWKITEKDQKLYATSEEDDITGEEEFYLVPLDVMKADKPFFENDNDVVVEVKKGLTEGDYLFTMKEGKIKFYNGKENKTSSKNFPQATELGYIKKIDGNYLKIDGRDWYDGGRHFCKIQRGNGDVCVTRNAQGDYYIKPEKVKNGWGKLLGILTGVTFIKAICARVASLTTNNSEDKKKKNEYSEAYSKWKENYDMVSDDIDKLQALDVQFGKEMLKSATEGAIVPHTEGNYNGILKNFFVEKVNNDIDTLSVGDVVYANNKFSGLVITIFVGNTPEEAKVGTIGDTSFMLNLKSGCLGVVQEIYTKGSGSYAYKYVRIKPEGGLGNFGMNPVNASTHGGKTCKPEQMGKDFYIQDFYVQDFDNDTKIDVVERKVLGAIVSVYNKTIGRYNEFGANDEIVKKEFITPLVQKGYGKALIASICSDSRWSGGAEEMYEYLFLRLGWANDLKTKDQYGFEVYDYELTYKDMRILYDRDLIANEENIKLRKILQDIKDFVTDEKNEMYYAKTNSYIKRTKFIDGVATAIDDFKDAMSHDEAEYNGIKEAKALKSKCLNEYLEKQVDYETKFEILEAKYDDLGEQMEKNQQIADDETKTDDERSVATDFILNNGDEFESLGEQLESAQSEWDVWKDTILQPTFDRLEELADLCNRCARLEKSARSKFARREYRQVTKDLKKFYKDYFGSDWKTKWKAKKNELKSKKYEITRGKYQTFWSKLGHLTAGVGLLPARNIVTAMMMLNLGRMTTMLEEIYNASKINDEAKYKYDDFLNKWYSIGGNKEKFTKKVVKYGKATPLIENMGDVKSENLAETFKEGNLDINKVAKSKSELEAIGTQYGYDKEQLKAIGTLQKYFANGSKYLNVVGVDDAVAAEVATANAFWAWCSQHILKIISFLGKILPKCLEFLKKNEEDCGGNTSFLGDEFSSGALEATQLVLFQSAVNDGSIKSITQEECDKITELILGGANWTDAVVKVHGGSFYTNENGELCYKNPISVGVIVAIAVSVIAFGGILFATLGKGKK